MRRAGRIVTLDRVRVDAPSATLQALPSIIEAGWNRPRSMKSHFLVARSLTTVASRPKDLEDIRLLRALKEPLA